MLRVKRNDGGRHGRVHPQGQWDPKASAFWGDLLFTKLGIFARLDFVSIGVDMSPVFGELTLACLRIVFSVLELRGYCFGYRSVQ